jgi:hypothetical protein
MDLARERLFHRCVLLRQAVLPGSIREVVWFLMGGGSVAGPVLVWCHDKAWPRVTMERCVESKGGCE